MEFKTRLKQLLLFFGISFPLALIFLYWILPHLGSLESNNGLLAGDALHYHNQALLQLENLKQSPSNFPKIWSSISATGNVFLLTLLYKIFGIGTKIYLLINSLLHSLSALILYEIVKLCRINTQHKSKIALALGLMYLLSPSHLIWVTQPLKDSFSNFGWLLLAYNMILLSLSRIDSSKKIIQTLLLHFVSVGFIIFVRPQYAVLFLVIYFFLFILTCAVSLRDPKKIALVSTLFLSSLVIYSQIPKLGVNSKEARIERESDLKNTFDWKWEESSILPNDIDNKFRTLAVIRMKLINKANEANTSFELDQHPNNAIDMLLRAPQLFFAIIFGPSPNLFSYKISMIKRLSLFLEAFPQWLLFFGFILSLIFLNKINPQYLTILAVSIPILILLSWINVNWGTLLRARFPFIHLLNVFSINGFLLIKEQWYQRKLEALA